MADPVVEFPDAVELVINYLRSVMPGTAVYSRVPDPRPAEFIRVERLGGTPDSRVTDRPRVDVGCWSTSEEDAEALMRRTRAYARAMAGTRGTTTVYRVREVGGPQWLPDSESGQPKYAFAFEFSARGARLESA